MIRNKDLICSLIIASERAASVARICRQNEHLLSLLVEEKISTEKNCRFVKDFKTLADVLVQQAVKYNLEKEFPTLKDHIYGEESQSFTNTIGDSVTIVLNDSKTDTIHVLSKVLDGDKEAANLLAECVHSQIQLDDVPVQVFPSECGELAAEELALWIDPIDSTAEYISGKNTSNYNVGSTRIPLNGLSCVTVLIGIFHRTTGVPIIGVINQPFYSCIDNEWKGRCLWGISYENVNLSNIPPRPICSDEHPIIAVSAIEVEENKKKLRNAGFVLISPAGAGYKILCVILNIIDAYILSYGSTYYWDTCGCHAILKSIGGNIWNYEKAVDGAGLNSIYYKEKGSASDVKLYSNKCGIIASKDGQLAQKIVDILKLE